MTVDILNSKLLKAALMCQGSGSNPVLQWIHDNEDDFNDTRYAEIVTLFADCQAAYDETPSNLHITTGSGTQQLSGIGSLPIPPNR